MWAVGVVCGMRGWCAKGLVADGVAWCLQLHALVEYESVELAEKAVSIWTVGARVVRWWLCRM